MKVHEFYGLRLNPLFPRLEKTGTFKTPWEGINTFLELLPPKIRNRILNYGVGIEIEVERSLGININGWIREADGSLRNNGQEYKTQYGARVYSVFRLLSDLEKVFKNEAGAYEFTERTSVHVHMDVRGFSEVDLNNLLMLYVLFEKSLFRFAGESRKDNIFCVPFLESDKCSPKPLSFGHVEGAEKYSALNMLTVRHFGTVEFRHMEGNADAQRIFTWVLLLSCLLYAAETFDHQQLYEALLKLKVESQYRRLLESVFFDLAAALPWKNEEIDSAVTDAKVLFVKEQ